MGPWATRRIRHGSLGVVFAVVLRMAASKGVRPTADAPVALLLQLASAHSCRFRYTAQIADNSDQQTSIDGAEFCTARPRVGQMICSLPFAALSMKYIPLLSLLRLQTSRRHDRGKHKNNIYNIEDMFALGALNLGENTGTAVPAHS